MNTQTIYRRLGLVASAAAALVFASHIDSQATIQPAIEPPATGEASTPADLPEAVLWLRDGQRVTGLLVSRSEQVVVLKLGSTDFEYPMANVIQFEVLPPVEERYRAQRSLVPDDDYEQRVALAKWAYQRRRLDLAIAELESILQTDSSNTSAKDLLALAKIQQRIEARAKAKADESRDTRPPTKVAVPGEGVPLLTQEQVNLMKVYEVDLTAPPRMNVRRSTITKMLRAYGDSPLIPFTQEGREALYRRTPAEILDLLFQLRARELYAEVEIQEQPASMKMFREQVHSAWLLNRCATAGCHGGPEGGRLQLATRRPNAEETYFTNFLILERFRTADGQALIDYDDPERSPLLHLGLARELSLTPHPVVPVRDGKGDRWKPVFHDADDEGFERALRWIRSMYRPRPEYPFEDPAGANADAVGKPAPPVPAPAPAPARDASLPSETGPATVPTRPTGPR